MIDHTTTNNDNTVCAAPALTPPAFPQARLGGRGVARDWLVIYVYIYIYIYIYTV